MANPEETPALGNEEPSDGELQETVETQAPAPESQESPSEEQGTDYWKRKYLDAKQAEEDRNLLRREIDDLKTRVQQSPAAGRNQDEADEDEQQLRAAAATPEGFWARKMLKEREEREELVQGLIYQRQMKDLSDDEQQAAVIEWKRNPHKYGSPIAAHEGLKLREREDALTKAQRENEEMRKRLAIYEKKRDPAVENAVPTASREAASRGNAPTYTRAQWEKEMDRLDEAGDIEGRARLQLRLRNKEISIK